MAQITEETLEVKEPKKSQMDLWRENIRKKNPDLAEADDEAIAEYAMRSYDDEHDYRKRSEEQNQRLNEAIMADPNVAAFFQEVYERGKDGHPELALLNLGDWIKAVINGEINEEEYIKHKEEEKAKKDADEKALEEQNKIFEEACKELDVDPTDFSNKITDKYYKPMAERRLTKELFKSFIKGLLYDEDVAQAEIKGRNAKIQSTNKLEKESTDGFSHASSAPVQNQPINKEFASLSSIAERRQRLRN